MRSPFTDLPLSPHTLPLIIHRRSRPLSLLHLRLVPLLRLPHRPRVRLLLHSLQQWHQRPILQVYHLVVQLVTQLLSLQQFHFLTPLPNRLGNRWRLLLEHPLLNQLLNLHSSRHQDPHSLRPASHLRNQPELLQANQRGNQPDSPQGNQLGSLQGSRQGSPPVNQLASQRDNQLANLVHSQRDNQRSSPHHNQLKILLGSQVVSLLRNPLQVLVLSQVVNQQYNRPSILLHSQHVNPLCSRRGSRRGSLPRSLRCSRHDNPLANRLVNP